MNDFISNVFIHLEGHVGIAKMLLDKGADITVKNLDGRTALDMSSSEIISHLLREEAGKEEDADL
jgi:hypothetical protein